MDEKDKQLNINASSLVDLKAELLRKQEEFRKERLQHGSKSAGRKPVFKKESVWNRKNAGVLQRAQKDLEQKQEEEDDLEKSRKALETKAKLYERMTNTSEIPEDESEPRFMVDFQKKVVDNIIEQREKQRHQDELLKLKREEERRKEEEEMKEEKLQLQEDVPQPKNPDEEWVEYTDSLGRSRCCMRKELPANVKEDVPFKMKGVLGSGRDLLSDDMYREMLREKWEKEMEEEANKPAGPVHYTNVKFDEVRDHGVGYYQFSKEEQARQEQLNQLKSLREQTVDHRTRAEKLKQKRKAIMAARLAKVKQRRMINTDIVDSESKPGSDSDDDMVGPKLDEMVPDIENKEAEVQPLLRNDASRQDAPVRDWDKGKEKEPENYYEKRRKERCEEFAPPSIYFNSQPKVKRSVPIAHDNNRQLWHRSKEVNPMSLLEENRVPVDEIRLHSPQMHQSAELALNSHSVAEQVSQGLKQLREEVDKTHTNTSDISIGQIPLPPKINTFGSQLQSDANIPHSIPDAIQSNIPSYNAEYNTNFAGAAQLGNAYPSLPPAGGHQSISGGTSHSHQPTKPCNLVGADYGYGVPENENIDTVSSNATHLPDNSTTLDANITEGIPQAWGDSSYHAVPVSYTSQIVGDNSSLAAPQPAHFSSAPMKPQTVRAPRYEPVNIHKLPTSLPAPPTSHNIPQYPSQENVHGSKKESDPRKGKDNVKYWMRQFDYQAGDKAGVASLKPSNIPFPSPYVQKKDGESEVFSKVDFDPSKPPPVVEKKQ